MSTVTFERLKFDVMGTETVVLAAGGSAELGYEPRYSYREGLPPSLDA